MTNTVQFGLNVDPSRENLEKAFRRARIADQHRLELITVQDHPYNRRHLETWTFLTALAMATEHVKVGTNVLSTPLRPPAMLAKKAATLSVLSGGRVELGLGAGGNPDGIQAMGGAKRLPAERFRAFEEVVEIIRGLWESGGRSFSYDGEFHQIRGAHFGPKPSHPLQIWVGAAGDQMLRLTGRLADGLFISSYYVSPEQLPRYNGLLDEGAEEAGRPTSAIRRGYNLMGALLVDGQKIEKSADQPGMIVGSIDEWVEHIVRFNQEYRQDTFIFWPVAGDEEAQVEVFAREVVPAVREALEAS